MSNYAEAAENISAGRALDVGARRRIDPLPNVPTVSEAGYKDYQVNVWYGLLAPAKTPKQAVDQLSQWCKAAMLAPELKPKWAMQGLDPVGKPAAEFASHLRQQYDEYVRVIREANIKGE